MSGQSRLERLGYQPDLVSDEQRSVIESLDDAEMALLLKIKERLDATGGDVEGHTEGGGVVW